MKASVALSLAMAASSLASRPKAMVYRGPAACQGCPEAIAHLLTYGPAYWDVTYAGPNEKVQVNAESLSQVILYAQPGGGDLARTWQHVKSYKQDVQDFVANGGIYAGFCLGAYMAGPVHGYDLLANGSRIGEECLQKGAQVTNRKNTIIQLDWTFGSGPRKGATDKGRWVFFQDGAVIKLSEEQAQNATMLGTFSANGNLASAIVRYGKGQVGMVGPHPEADFTWYRPYGIHNPDGIRFDIGYDFIQTLLDGV